MPPYQKLYIVLGIGVGVSAIITALPFDFVYATLFLFGCLFLMSALLWRKKYTTIITTVGIGLAVIASHVGWMRYEQQLVHAQEGESLVGIAMVHAVQEKEKFTEAVIVFEDSGMRLLATVFGGGAIEEGSRVRAYCRVGRIENFKEIPYENMKAVQKIFGSCEKFAWSVIDTRSWHYHLIHHRLTVQARLEEPLNKENGFLLRGMVFGDDARIDKEAKEDFKNSGISHILAVSGFNIALFGVWGLSALMGVGIPRKIASVVVIGGIGVFVVMVGMSASVVRAALMGSIPLVGSLLDRASITRHIFLVTVMGMIVWQPYSLWYDIGFQLSVAATAGLLFIPPFITEKFSRTKIIPDVIMQTIAATVATAPILLWHFKTVSLLGLFTNVVVAVPVVQIMGIAVGRLVTSAVAMGDGGLAWAQEQLLTFLYEIAQVVARYDWISLNFLTGAGIVGVGVLLIGIKYGMKRKRNTITINNETWYIITI